MLALSFSTSDFSLNRFFVVAICSNDDDSLEKLRDSLKCKLKPNLDPKFHAEFFNFFNLKKIDFKNSPELKDRIIELINKEMKDLPIYYCCFDLSNRDNKKAREQFLVNGITKIVNAFCKDKDQQKVNIYIDFDCSKEINLMTLEQEIEQLLYRSFINCVKQCDKDNCPNTQLLNVTKFFLRESHKDKEHMSSIKKIVEKWTKIP